MPVTVVNTGGTYDKGNAVSEWSARISREYIKNEEFAQWSGKKEGSVFQYKEELTKKKGDNITFSLVARLEDDGVEDDDTLEGTEEALGNFADTVTVHQLRKAVIRGDHEQTKTLIDILKEGKFMLRKWAMDTFRNFKIARLLCPHLDGVTTYAASTESEKDAHLTANDDRYIFGALKSNMSTGDHSASLLNVDVTADTLTRSMISKMKRMAETCDPLIMPIELKGIRQMFVAFCGSDAHRDLKADLDVVHASSAPREKGMTNPSFQDDDLLWEDVVIRKVPKMESVGNVGAASAPIYQVAFCGAQAVLVAWGKHISAIRNGPEGQDYGNQMGTGIKETRGLKKAHYNDVQHGMVTGYVAAEADA